MTTVVDSDASSAGRSAASASSANRSVATRVSSGSDDAPHAGSRSHGARARTASSAAASTREASNARHVERSAARSRASRRRMIRAETSRGRSTRETASSAADIIYMTRDGNAGARRGRGATPTPPPRETAAARARTREARSPRREARAPRCGWEAGARGGLFRLVGGRRASSAGTKTAPRGSDARFLDRRLRGPSALAASEEGDRGAVVVSEGPRRRRNNDEGSPRSRARDAERRALPRHAAHATATPERPRRPARYHGPRPPPERHVLPRRLPRGGRRACDAPARLPRLRFPAEARAFPGLTAPLTAPRLPPPPRRARSSSATSSPPSAGSCPR